MCSENDGDMLKGPRSQFERTLTDQVWDNMSSKMKKMIVMNYSKNSTEAL